ncbi:hypothetical protein Dimus_004051 [Dionaea muscipula]
MLSCYRHPTCAASLTANHPTTQPTTIGDGLMCPVRKSRGGRLKAVVGFAGGGGGSDIRFDARRLVSGLRWSSVLLLSSSLTSSLVAVVVADAVVVDYPPLAGVVVVEVGFLLLVAMDGCSRCKQQWRMAVKIMSSSFSSRVSLCSFNLNP